MLSRSTASANAALAPGSHAGASKRARCLWGAVALALAGAALAAFRPVDVPYVLGSPAVDGFALESAWLPSSRDAGTFGTAHEWLRRAGASELLVLSDPSACGSGALVLVDGESGACLGTVKLSSSRGRVEGWGARVLALGDIDGDGWEDLLAFGALQGGGGEQPEGFAVAVSLGAKRVLWGVAGLAPSPNGAPADSLSRVDLDRDGVPDFIARSAGPGGQAHVRSGRTGALLRAVDDSLEAAEAWTWTWLLSDASGAATLTWSAREPEFAPLLTIRLIESDAVHRWEPPPGMRLSGFLDAGRPGTREVWLRGEQLDDAERWAPAVLGFDWRRGVVTRVLALAAADPGLDELDVAAAAWVPMDHGGDHGRDDGGDGALILGGRIEGVQGHIAAIALAGREAAWQHREATSFSSVGQSLTPSSDGGRVAVGAVASGTATPSAVAVFDTSTGDELWRLAGEQVFHLER